MTGIVDYNAGNIRSVELALLSLGSEYRISKNPTDLEGADRLIFPGVGEAKFAMRELKKTGFDSFLRDWAASGKPLLGVCLGSQIIFSASSPASSGNFPPISWRADSRCRTWAGTTSDSGTADPRFSTA